MEGLLEQVDEVAFSAAVDGYILVSWFRFVFCCCCKISSFLSTDATAALKSLACTCYQKMCAYYVWEQYDVIP